MAPPNDHAARVRELYDDGKDPSFSTVVDTIGPASDAEFADLIDIDGRLRIVLGREVTLERYLETRGIEESETALDAAIEMAMRSAARSNMPGSQDVEAMVQAYPRFEKLIRDAALLAYAVQSTTSVRRQMSEEEPPRQLPCAIGPRLPDGRPRYELLELVGEGATGGVYRAVDRNLSDNDAAATVAVKVFSPPDDPGLAAWMRDEALKARRVVHENVVRALDRGDLETGGSYIVYEFVAGGDLGQRIRSEGLPMHPRSAARIVAAVARGVQAIHAAGLVHCDLKPGNIALTETGRPKVADFGIAMREGQSPRVQLSEAGSPVGTPGFISPEQLRGEPGAFSFPSDIYSLGAILAYLVSGRVPRARSGDAGASQSRWTMELGRDYDPDLRRIVARATASNPADRHPSASELADDLEHWIERRPLHWGRTSLWRRSKLFVRRRPVLAAVALLAMLSVIVAGSIKLREDARRASIVDVIEEMIAGYILVDVGGENLPILSAWQSIADSEYFRGTPLPRNVNQIEIFRKVLSHPDIAERPGSCDALLLRSALALALVSREGDYLEAEPLAAECRLRWLALFGPEDAMARRMAVIEAAAAANRLLAEAERGAALDPAGLDSVQVALDTAAAQLPALDVNGPVRKLYEDQCSRLAALRRAAAPR